MRMRIDTSRWIVVAGAVLVAPVAAPQTHDVKETASARIALARRIASDPEIVRDVAAKNAENETMAEVQRKDKEWMAQPAYPLKAKQLKSPCADRLRALIADDKLVVEAILMDHQGANVCISSETTDYWQGDELKWQKPFAEKLDVFVDEPAFDQSSGVYAVQLSVPVLRDGQRIGALCLTLKVRKDLLNKGA